MFSYLHWLCEVWFLDLAIVNRYHLDKGIEQNNKIENQWLYFVHLLLFKHVDKEKEDRKNLLEYRN